MMMMVLLIRVELLTKQKPTAKSSRLFAHKKMPTGQKPTKHYRHCIKCGHLAVGIWSWGNGFGGQMSVGKCPWANIRGQISVGKYPWANVCGQMSVGKYPWANIRGQMSVGKCPWANICEQMAVGCWPWAFGFWHILSTDLKLI